MITSAKISYNSCLSTGNRFQVCQTSLQPHCRNRCKTGQGISKTTVNTYEESSRSAASSIKSDGKNIIEIGAKTRSRVQSKIRGDPSLPSGERLDMARYLELGPEFIASVPLPLGARIVREGLQDFKCTLPRVDIFEVWLQMTSDALVISQSGRVDITSDSASIIGSRHVEDLRLYERYDCRSEISWTATENGVMECKADLVVHVDIPAPFSLMPKFVVREGGNMALGTMMSVISEEFTRSLVRDFEAWVADPELRERRQKMFWDPGASSGNFSAMRTIDVLASTLDYGSVDEGWQGGVESRGEIGQEDVEEKEEQRVEAEFSQKSYDFDNNGPTEQYLESERESSSNGHVDSSRESPSIQLEVPLEELLCKLRNPGSVTRAEFLKTRRHLERLQKELQR